MEKLVLCVDDDEDSVYLLKRAMDEAGQPYAMQVASDGEIAIEYLKGCGKSGGEAHPWPSLVVLDLKLPRTPGLGVLKWIRREADLKIPVVVLSSSQSEIDISTAYHFGANAYLVKPSDYEHLLEMTKTIAGFWLVQNVTSAEIAIAVQPVSLANP